MKKKWSRHQMSVIQEVAPYSLYSKIRYSLHQLGKFQNLSAYFLSS